ncbi:MAG: ketopantoate reductase family protein [Clostridiales bacterium]|nr:ketopantoate reductase family protein [Clostridiales bacterium]
MIQNVACIGLGAMGAFFAPRLCETLGRDHFYLIAGGARKERLENQGVTINGTNWRFPVMEPETVPSAPADLILVAVKEQGLDQAISDIKNYVGPDTIIISVMNGIDSEERIASVYGWDHMLFSYMRMSVVMKDGVADFDPNWGSIHYGDAVNDLSNLSDKVLAVKELWERSQIPYDIDENMLAGIWFKFMVNVGQNMTSAVLDLPYRAYQNCEEANWLRKGAMREVLAIAQAKNVPLTENDVERQDAQIRRLPPENLPSTLQDIRQKKKTEVELFSGTVVKLGKELGIPTPINEVYLHAIHVLEARNRGEF